MEIKLTQGKIALIDDADAQFIGRFHWCAHRQKCGNWYASTNIPHPSRTERRANGRMPKQTIQMHRLLLNAKKGQVVDHIDGDGLNNQRTNLRIVTPKENAYHKTRPMKPKGGKTSRFKGVHLNRRTGLWRINMKKDNKYVYAAYFRNEEDAARAYDAKARELYGRFAVTNFKD